MSGEEILAVRTARELIRKKLQEEENQRKKVERFFEGLKLIIEESNVPEMTLIFSEYNFIEVKKDPKTGGVLLFVHEEEKERYVVDSNSIKNREVVEKLLKFADLEVKEVML
jgi:hypothetical protein